MREEERIDRILEKISKEWHKCPDLRLGQLLINIYPAFEWHMFYKADEWFEEALDKWMQEI